MRTIRDRLIHGDVASWNAALVVLSMAVAGCNTGSSRLGELDSEESSLTTDAGDLPGAATGTEAGAEGSDASSGSPRLDVADGAEAGAGDGGGACDCGDNFGFIWVANSKAGTVSKINTRTMEEEGRYITRADGAGNPSRTSVSIDGTSVVVANRYGGLAKFWALPELCDPEANGIPGLQTSTGADDVLPFGEDDCLAWTADFPRTVTTQRPVAWTPGTLDEVSCQRVDQKIWTATGEGGQVPGSCDLERGITVHRLNGDTGVIEASIDIPVDTVTCWVLGAYGGAVDRDGNFWGHNNKLVFRVDYDTLDVETFEGAKQYGLTVDTQGRVWTGKGGTVYRLDYPSGAWQVSAFYGWGDSGIAEDHQGRIWTAGYKSVVAFDADTLRPAAKVDLDVISSTQFKGISVDVDGFVWAIGLQNSTAFKIDPHALQVVGRYDGLDSPYTYSDMAGGQLHNVTCRVPEG